MSQELSDEELRAQINALIRDEIQEGINDYIDSGKAGEGLKGEGFAQKQEDDLTVNISNAEVERLLKEYKKIKRRKKSNLSEVKKIGLVDKNGKPL
tara:strand:+ start:297 stop:584 length:288 start_codon:yes stop_codon:yes gene_type:complete